jgi:hypothetical protein
MITATGGTNSATADMMIAASSENRQTTIHDSTISTRHVPIKMK